MDKFVDKGRQEQVGVCLEGLFRGIFCMLRVDAALRDAMGSGQGNALIRGYASVGKRSVC